MEGIARGQPAVRLHVERGHLGAQADFQAKDFVGKRSLTRADMAKPDRKQLVGILTARPDELLPEEGVAWPVDLELGTSRSGKIDGLTQPAPSGGPNLPITGFDANHTYRVQLYRPDGGTTSECLAGWPNADTGNLLMVQEVD